MCYNKHMQDGSVLGNFFRNKWVRFVLVVGLIVVISVAIFVNIDIHKDAAIVFNVAPVDATITINGDSNYTNGANSISPGDYEIKISHEGLESKTIKVSIAPRQVITISTFLSGPDNNFEFYELKENYSSMQMLKTIASRGNNITTDHDTSAETFIDDYDRKTQIVNILPIDYFEMDETNKDAGKFFGIDLNDNCDKIDLCLIVAPIKNVSHEEALEFIRSQGYDPNDYDIIFQENITL